MLDQSFQKHHLNDLKIELVTEIRIKTEYGRPLGGRTRMIDLDQDEQDEDLEEAYRSVL